MNTDINTEMHSYLHTAIEAAQAASRLHKFYQGQRLEIATKSSITDLVTEVDQKSESAIREVILTAHPEHVVLGEEEGQNAYGSQRWIVDPLDGTLNYAHGFPFYCVSIALEIEGELKVGVVLDTVRDELFYAVRGQGAFCNGRKISSSSEPDLRSAMLATGFSYDPEKIGGNVQVFERMLHQARTVRRPGAAALDLSYVACGRLDGFWELTLKPWDVAAGVLIIQEAGGTVTTPAGAPYNIHLPEVVASNGHLHSRFLRALDLEPSVFL